MQAGTGPVTHRSRGQHHVCTDQPLLTSFLSLEERLRPVPVYPGQGGSSSSAYTCLEPPACLGDGPADPLHLGVGGHDTHVPCPGHHSSPPCPSPGTTVPTPPTPACQSGLCCWNVMKTERLLVAEPVCDVSLCEKCLLHPVLLIEHNTDLWCQFFLRVG